VCIRFLANHRESATETLALIRQEFGEENLSLTLVFEWQFQGRLKKAIQVKSKVKRMLIIFFDIKDMVHKEFVLAGQSLPHTTVMFYGDSLKM
jgi:hypothetical protein